MLVIGLILSMFGIGLFCWLIFTLAVYALPFFIGLTAGMAAFHSGAGVLGALLVGVVIFPGSGITGNLADKAKKLGIPVLDHREDGA